MLTWSGLGLVETRSWKDIGYRGFGPVMAALLLFLLGDTAVAVLTCTLWAIAVALPYALAVPVQYYAAAHTKHKTLARWGTLVITVGTLNALFSFCLQLTPLPLRPPAILEYALGFFLTLTIGAFLFERLLKPRLASKT